MKKTLKLFLLLTSQICISQINEANQLMIDGEKAFLENDFLLAKENYTKAADLDVKNKDCWFNLGASELKLEEFDSACEHFYQAYLLNDGEAVKIIKENCPNFRNGSILSLNDVEEKPKFIYGGKKYLLIIDNNLNPKYNSLLKRRLKFSTIMSKYKGRVFVQFQINKFNILDAKIVSVSGDQKEAEVIKKEMQSILNNLFNYVSAKNKGLNVDLWDKYSLILNFLMGS